MANGEFPVSIVIKAVDQATEKIGKINAKLQKQLEPVKKLNNAFKAFGDATGMARVSKAFSGVLDSGKELGGALKTAGLELFALAAGAGYAAYKFVGLVKESADAADQIKNVSDRLGISTTSFQELAYAALQSNVPLEEFSGAMTKLEKGMGEAALGQGEVFAGFYGLGISALDANMKVKKLDDVLPEIADKLSHVGNASVRNMILMKLFGREGAKMSDLFANGAAGIAAWRKEAQDIGAVMGPETIKNGEALNKAFNRVDTVFASMRNTIADKLFPVFTKLADSFVEFYKENKGSFAEIGDALAALGERFLIFFNANKKEIGDFISAFAHDLPDTLKQVGTAFGNLVDIFSPVVSVLKDIITTLGPFNVLIIGLGVSIAGPVLIALGAFVFSLYGLATALGVTTLSFGAFMLELLPFVAAAIGVVVVLAELALAARIIYKNFEPLKDWLAKIFTDPMEALREFLGLLKDLKAHPFDKLKELAGFNTTFGMPTTMMNGGSTEQAPALGAGALVRAPSSPVVNTPLESTLRVMFENVPKGVRVDTLKSEVPFDFSMGLAGVH